MNITATAVFDPTMMTLTVTGGWFKEPHVLKISRDTATLKGTYRTNGGKSLPIYQSGIKSGGMGVLLIDKTEAGFFKERLKEPETWPMRLSQFTGEARWSVDAGGCQYFHVRSRWDGKNWERPVFGIGH